MTHMHSMISARILHPACVALLAAGGLVPTTAFAQGQDTIQLTGVIRDFRARGEAGGHTDFESPEPTEFDLEREYVANLVEPTLGADRKPVFNSSANRGHLVKTLWKDGQNRPICPCLPALANDRPGRWGAWFPQDIASQTSFETWYNDTLGVNRSMALTITLARQGNVYVYDDQSFFPADDQLFGNYRNTGRNFHFTFELHTTFNYDRAAGQVFSFRGDDDVWVFINGQLAIDLGGRHGPKEQFIDLNRLPGLEDGQTCALDFFSAERHTDGSHVRISTNLPLVTRPVTISASFD